METNNFNKDTFNQWCSQLVGIDGLEFDSDWNSLMMVVDKVESLKFNSPTCTNKSPIITMGNCWCYIHIYNDTDKKSGRPVGDKYYYWSVGDHSVLADNRLNAVVKALWLFFEFYKSGS
jgi:hypothetical protein